MVNNNIFNFFKKQKQKQHTIMDSELFERFQPNTKRGIAKSCEICVKNFSVLAMQYQHQCKRCLRAVCKQCGKTKRDVYKLDMIKNQHRLCSICTQQSDYIKQYITTNKLQFGKDSTIAKKWLNRIPQNNQQQDGEQQKTINNKLTYQIFTSMWNAYNYSIREFIGLLTFQRNQKDIYKLVNIVYEELLRRGFDGKLQRVLYVIVFMLCFSNSRTAAKLVQYLLILKQSVTDNKQLLQFYLKTLRIQQSQTKKATEYLSNKLKLYTNTFSINVLSFQCTVNILTRILEKDKIQYQYIIFALVLEDNLQYLIKNKNNKIQCDLEIVRKSKFKKYLEKQRQLNNVKISQFIKAKSNFIQNIPSSPQKSISATSIQLITNNSKRQNKQDRNRQLKDTLSNKTKSIRDQASFKQIETSQRKTQKPLLIPKFSGVNSSPDYETQVDHQNQSSRCYQCQKNTKKIQDLQSKLKLKQRQIQSLNFKLSFIKKQSNQQQKYNIYENEGYKNYQNRYQPKLQQNNYNLSQQNQYRRQNIVLKSKIQQLETNIRILKSNLPNQSPFSYSTQKNDKISGQQQQGKTISTLKNVLQSKNKQLQQVMKKNKLLNYQIEQMQRQYSVKKPQANEGTRQQLLKKIAELSIRVNDQQGQKLQLSEELFGLRQEIRKSQINLTKSEQINNNSNNNNKNNNKQCAIF